MIPIPPFSKPTWRVKLGEVRQHAKLHKRHIPQSTVRGMNSQTVIGENKLCYLDFCCDLFLLRPAKVDWDDMFPPKSSFASKFKGFSFRHFFLLTKRAIAAKVPCDTWATVGGKRNMRCHGARYQHPGYPPVAEFAISVARKHIPFNNGQAIFMKFVVVKKYIYYCHYWITIVLISVYIYYPDRGSKQSFYKFPVVLGADPLPQHGDEWLRKPRSDF